MIKGIKYYRHLTYLITVRNPHYPESDLHETGFLYKNKGLTVLNPCFIN